MSRTSKYHIQWEPKVKKRMTQRQKLRAALAADQSAATRDVRLTASGVETRGRDRTVSLAPAPWNEVSDDDKTDPTG